MADRKTIISKARDGWIRRLVDPSRRNNLLYFREFKRGTLNLCAANLDEVDKLINPPPGSGPVSLDKLVTTTAETRASLAKIVERARSNFEEKGLDTLFLSIGLASWRVEDGGRAPAAPVILVPVELKPQARGMGDWTIQKSGDARLSDVLVHTLRSQFNVSLQELDLTDLDGTTANDRLDVQRVFRAVLEQVRQVPEVSITNALYLSNFAFQKMAIVRDLQQLDGPLQAHDIVAALAGDANAVVRGGGGDDRFVEPQSLDGVPPENEYLILDADSSQQAAIAAVLAGASGVISGPPGTGKSQTIANLIAELTARGKRVLFVAEKRAALDVVLNRLTKAGLGHLCLDCHGAELTRRRVAEQLGESLGRVRAASQPRHEHLHLLFVERRNVLNEHVRQMHAPRQPGGLSLFELYSRLLSLDTPTAVQARVPREALEALDERSVETASRQVHDLAALAPHFVGTSPSPWTGASLQTDKDLREAVEAARGLDRRSLPALESAIGRVTAETGLRAPSTWSDVGPFIEAARSISGFVQEVGDGLLQEDTEELSLTLRPARSFFTRIIAFLFDGRFRAAVDRVRYACQNPRLSSVGALSLVDRAEVPRQLWRRLAVNPNGRPGQATHLNEVEAASADVERSIQVLGGAVRSARFDAMPLAELHARCKALAMDAPQAAQVLRVNQLTAEIRRAGFSNVLLEIPAMDPSAWPRVLKGAWLHSCIEEIQLLDPATAAFAGRLHDDVVEEFRSLDSQRIQAAVQRVQRAHAEAAIGALNQRMDQAQIVRRETEKRARHKHLRRLMTEAPEVVLSLRPCWMASPLSVSQLLPGDRPLFDVVIFDEASQVFPEDAVTALLRARQVVIAGDQYQLPPTSFFAAGRDDDADDDAEEQLDGGTQGFESILDVASTVFSPPWSLDWHYRSRDESLIAFSNRHIYLDRLVTFPGPAAAPAVTHHLVPNRTGMGGQEESASDEVNRVVDLIATHAREAPQMSLGVITMGLKHADRISMALQQRRADDAKLDAFVGLDHTEPFFVKNLERVQGDERDAIILSIGYGKDQGGSLPHRFGPLAQEGGERRLNVAVSRARCRMTVVSSFSHVDMRPDYPKTGVRLLRAFLEYAASQGRTLVGTTHTDVPLNGFEQAIYDELRRHRMELLKQVGVSRYRIDLVAVHPMKPGRMVLAIECDGATYHSSPTARDRDRLRQQQLESLGWRFHRIWSTDWFLRRQDEVNRVLEAYGAAVRHADEIDSGARATPNPRVEREPVGVEEHRPSPGRTDPPVIRPGLKIDEYNERELRAIAEWILSDGVLRTDDEVVGTMMRDLGFQRRGARIVQALQRAARDARGRGRG